MVTMRQHTLPSLLWAASAAFSDRPALSRVEKDGIRVGYDYSGLERAVRRFALSIVDMGVKTGDRVVILCENRPEWAVAYFGIMAAGAVAVPVLVDFAPEQIANIVDHAAAAAVCATEKTLPRLSGIDVPFSVIRLDTIDELGFNAVVAGTTQRRSFKDPKSVLPGDSLLPSDLACILYTSGTSGNSKGVMLTHENIVSNAIATRAVFGLKPEDRVLSVMPLAHTLESTMGLVTPLLQGCAIHYLDGPPTPTALASALQLVKPTVMVIVPLIIEKLYRAKVEPKLQNHPLYRFAPTRGLAIKAAGRKLQDAFGGAIRFLGIGGAALANDVERFLLAARFPYAIGYGLTETAPLVAAAIPYKTSIGSTGRALDGVNVRIAQPQAGEAHSALHASGEGEIQVRGPNVMTGYYKDSARSAEAFTSDGWFKTGDLGIIDSRGLIHVRGRLKAMILGPSGENIYPEEIESLLSSSGLVEESLVYAAKDGALVALVVLNERAKAMIIDARARVSDTTGHIREALADTSHALAQESERLLARLRASTNTRLAAFSRIARILVQESPFEKTATLKIKRYLYPASPST
ncbi:long-chain fatty acid--CoA ligase [Spirochaetota bacterium]